MIMQKKKIPKKECIKALASASNLNEFNINQESSKINHKVIKFNLLNYLKHNKA